MVKNKKYESFDAGRAGQGQIDLHTGKMEFAHNDTSSDSSILPISISHVYSTTAATDPQRSAVCGEGFKLNLHQTLRKESDDPDDARYVLTDAAEREHEFDEAYYYLDDDGKRKYHKPDQEDEKITRDDIIIGYDGKLTYETEEEKETYEILSETKTDSGLTLKTELKGFRNSADMELRHEEIQQTESDIRSLERSIADLTYSLREYSKFQPEEGSDETAYMELKRLQAELEEQSLAIEKKSLEFFNGTKKKCPVSGRCPGAEDCQGEGCPGIEHCPGMKKCTHEGSHGTKCYQVSLLDLTDEYNTLIEKDDLDIGGLNIIQEDSTQDDITPAEQTIIDLAANVSDTTLKFEFNDKKLRYAYKNETGQNLEKMSLRLTHDPQYTTDAYGAEDLSIVYDHFFYPQNNKTEDRSETRDTSPILLRSRRMSRVVQFLQERFNESVERKNQDIRKKSFELEKKNLEDQLELMGIKAELLVKQDSFRGKKNEYDEEEETALKSYYDNLKVIAEADLNAAKIMLKYKSFALNQYKEQIPVNYIIDRNGLTYGFNEFGNMVSAWDAYENYVSLVYEEGEYTDGEYRCGNLAKIVDTDERETLFEYNGGKLSAIIDPLDRRTGFSYYIDSDLLEKIIYPNGDESVFEYTKMTQENGEVSLLSKMLSPTGAGIRLEFDEDCRPITLTAVTGTESVSAECLIPGSDEEELARIVYNINGTSAYVTDIKTGYGTAYMFDREGEWVSEYTELNGHLKNIQTYDVGRGRCHFTMQQTDFENNLIGQAVDAGNENVVHAPNGSVTINGSPEASDRYAEWNVDVSKLPEYATDLVLSGFAIADSSETLDRRMTAYCTRFGHEHLQNEGADSSVAKRRFELRAEVTYQYGTESKTKTFIASFDPNTKTKQFAAVPITLDEKENSRPVKPSSIRIIADYSHNSNICHFTKLSLADGDWTYAETDEEERKKFECGSRMIADRTVDGVAEGRFVSYAESIFIYDAKGRLIEEETKLERVTIKKTATGETDGGQEGSSEPEEYEYKTYVTTHEYNKQSKPIRTISPNGMVSETVYDSKGNVIKTVSYHRSNPASRFVQQSEQNEKGQVTAEFDQRGENRTVLKYLDGTNIVTGSVGPDGQETALGLDPHTGELLAISSSVRGEPNETKFAYTRGMLTRLSAGRTDYDYLYDGWGRNTEIRIADAWHVRFTYGKEPHSDNDVVTAEYANGEQYESVSDKFGKLLKVDRIFNGVRTHYISNKYDSDDRLIEMADYLAGTVAKYEYNEDGSLNRDRNGDVTIVTDRNIDGAVERIRYTIDGVGDQIYGNVYDEEGKLSQIILPNGDIETVEYDELGRVTGIEHPVHHETVNYYRAGGNTTSLIASVENDEDCSRYTYDVNGNVTEIRENGRLSVRYKYDGLGRLVREDNVGMDETYVFDYDTNGNIRFKNTYNFTLKDVDVDPYCTCRETEDRSQSKSYRYEKDGNRDRLREFSGERCDYDNLGNPTIYRNRNLEWSHLRNLMRYGAAPADEAPAGTADDVTFTYDASGLRMSKTRADTNTKFFWGGDKLLAEKRTTPIENLEFDDIFEEKDAQGNIIATHPCAYVYNDPCENPCPNHSIFLSADIVDISYLQGADGYTGFTVSKQGGSDVRTYYYRKNIQGDITHIFDSNGNVKAEYAYDAWGNHIIVSDEEGIGALNPFRYRGYYFDGETGLYYLKTRYYDPQTGRFINADSIDIFDETSGDINGLNLYMYCGNNPVMNYDPTGKGFWGDLWDKTTKAVGDFFDSTVGRVVVTIAVVAAVVALTVLTAGIGGILAGALVGAAIGGISGAAIDIVTQGLTNGFGNIDWGSVGMSALFGAATGAIFGGIGGGMTGTVIKGTNVTIRTVRNSELTKGAQAIRAGLAKNSQGHTISSARAGQLIHKGFKAGMPGKETRIPGGRIDFLAKKAIIELKPNNPRAIAEGIKQLQRYNAELGGKFKMILVLY